MPISVGSTTLSALLENKNIQLKQMNSLSTTTLTGRLVIPEYQRAYRWGSEQIVALLNNYNEYLRDLNKEQSDFGYYLGSLILHSSDGGEVLNIIDGQQRLTSLSIICTLQSQGETALDIEYTSPESQQQILQNLKHLKDKLSNYPSTLDPTRVNLTLVVTDSEDEAYQFFETQNTGGVRLGGVDIIKAMHLREISDSKLQDSSAIKWETLGDLILISNSLIKARFWQELKWKNVPSHREPDKLKRSIVDELGERTNKGKDIAYGRVSTERLGDGTQVLRQQQYGYDIRQPLHRGVNTINYIEFFETMRKKYLLGSSTTGNSFEYLYFNLIEKLHGCGYLKELFDVCILTYVSQFGDGNLRIAAIKIFRVVYSPRVSLGRAVREASIPKFIAETRIVDRIANSYSPDDAFYHLDNFDFTVNPDNLEPDTHSVKKKFVHTVLKHFDVKVSRNEAKDELAELFKKEINKIAGLTK